MPTPPVPWVGVELPQLRMLMPPSPNTLSFFRLFHGCGLVSLPACLSGYSAWKRLQAARTDRLAIAATVRVVLANDMVAIDTSNAGAAQGRQRRKILLP